MKPLGPSKKWVLAAIGLLLALFILKIVLLLTAKSKITVDYVAEYNRTSRPKNYDPNDNAAPYYQKAFDAFVKMPNELRNLYIDWPADYDNTEQTLLGKWLTSNTLAFDYFKKGINKPYYWTEKKSEKDNITDYIILPEETKLRELTKALGWDAKLKANKGKFRIAFEDILKCYKAGNHECRSNLLLLEQHSGLRIKQDAVRSAFVILDKSKVGSEALKFFHNSLQAEFDNDTYVPSAQTEKYFLYDRVQRHFIDNGKGTGRLAFSASLKYITLGNTWSNLKHKLYYCFAGPTKNEIVEQIERLIVVSDQMMTKTPWQVKSESRDYLKEMRNIEGSRDVLEQIKGSTESIFHSYHKTRAQTEALIAVLAALRYKADTDQFPATLNELVSAGYLQSVPADPYSNGPLVYKLTEDNFKLYSVGEDFVDDDGSVNVKTEDAPRRDILFWPVRRLEHLREKFEKQKAEARREIEEANRPD